MLQERQRNSEKKGLQRADSTTFDGPVSILFIYEN
jgi:hypothetical protein